jgi:hypothetical protein
LDPGSFVAWAYEITENPLIAIVQMPACAPFAAGADGSVW